MNCISDSVFLPVNCLQSFSCAEKGIKATNLLKLYTDCNFSQSFTETLTMLAPMCGFDQYFTVHRHIIVRLIVFFSFKSVRLFLQWDKNSIRTFLIAYLVKISIIFRVDIQIK